MRFTLSITTTLLVACAMILNTPQVMAMDHSQEHLPQFDVEQEDHGHA